MGKAIVFGLGKAESAGLTNRTLTIYNVGVEPRTTLYGPTVQSAEAEVVEIELAENLLCEAQLVDTREGHTSDPAIVRFNTNDLLFPAPWLSRRLCLSEDSPCPSLAFLLVILCRRERWRLQERQHINLRLSEGVA